MLQNKKTFKKVIISLLTLCSLFASTIITSKNIKVFNVKAETEYKYWDPITSEEKTITSDKFTLLGSTTPTSADRFGMTMDGTKWYVIRDTFNVKSYSLNDQSSWKNFPAITVSGNVNILLLDGCNLNVESRGQDSDNGGAGIYVPEGSTLTIWGQKAGTGKLTAIGTKSGCGIGGQKNWTPNKDATNVIIKDAGAGNITINGGTVYAYGKVGIGGVYSFITTKIDGSVVKTSSVTINHGSVYAYGKLQSASSSGEVGIGGVGQHKVDVSINGGYVYAEGGALAFGTTQSKTKRASGGSVLFASDASYRYSTIGENALIETTSSLSINTYGAVHVSSTEQKAVEVNYDSNRHKVNFKENGGTYTNALTMLKAKEGEEISLPGNINEYAKDGFNFVGWNTDSDAKVKLDSVTMGSKDIDVYAIWKEPGHSITYDANTAETITGTLPVDENTYSEDEDITISSDTISRENYKLVGWNTDSNATTNLESLKMGDSDITLYAIWKRVYGVTYSKNTTDEVEGTLPTESVEYAKDETVTVSNDTLTREDYTFVGWNTDINATIGVSSFTMPENDVVLYAIWEKSTHGVTYNTNTTDEVEETLPVDLVEYAQDETVTVSNDTLTRDGYTFVGWNTDQYSTVGIESFSMPNDEVVLYAIWKQCAYSIIYDGNGNTSGEVPTDNNTYNKGVNVSLNLNPSLVKDGYTFSGWALDKEGTQLIENGIVTISDNVTLYAVWQKDISKDDSSKDNPKNGIGAFGIILLALLILLVIYAAGFVLWFEKILLTAPIFDKVFGWVIPFLNKSKEYVLKLLKKNKSE